jgi:hypothetical protein
VIDHKFMAQPGCNICVCGEPEGKHPIERWLFLALLVRGARMEHDPDSLADDIAWSVNQDGRLGQVEVGAIPGPQWLTPETLVNLLVAARGGA